MSISDSTLQDVYKAKRRIGSVAQRTPLVPSPMLAERTGTSVHLKLESLQRTGSFKIRGAANKMLSLTGTEKARGVITVSSGNHGRAVATLAQSLGIRAVICMSSRVPRDKVEAIRQLGAEVVLHGNSYEEAEVRALHLLEQRGLTMIEPFDDPLVIAGQGTIALEILEDLPEVDTVIVPLSGGGLLSGIALAMKEANPSIRTIGVSMDRAPVMYHSLRAGRPIEMEEEDTLADALVGNIGVDNRFTFRMIQQYVDDVVLVSEEEIAEAMALALKEHRLIVEGGGAVGIAALWRHKVDRLAGSAAVVVSGGNADLPSLVGIMREHLS
jgi:threonine dehydratase